MGRDALKTFECEQQVVSLSGYQDGSIEIAGADANGEIQLTSDEAVRLGTWLINTAWPRTSTRRNKG